MKFKVGDKVKILDGPHENHEGVVKLLDETSTCYRYCVGFSDDTINWFRESHLKLSKEQKSMDIKASFALIFKSEPKKSFRKAGITNGDDLLTDEGQNIFLTWLLYTKHADEFKKDVIDGLLDEAKK